MAVFWLTIIVSTGANITITMQISNIEHKADKIRSQIENLANDAVSIYETSGEKALTKWYKRIYKRYEIRAILISQNKERLGRSVRKSHDEHDDLDDFFEDNDKHRSEKIINFRRPMINPRVSVISSSGQHYVFKVLPSPYIHKKLGSPSEYRWLRFLVTLIIISIASFWLSRHVVKPVVILKSASQKMASGQLSTRVSQSIGRRKDELGELGNSFDNMAEQLERTITGQKQLLRDISHEIRTPLTRQRIAIDLIREQLGEDDAFTKELLEKIESQNNKLNELIENLLTLNRLGEEAKNVTIEPVNLFELLKALVEDAELEANTKDIDLQLRCSETTSIHGNSVLLGRAFENVVGNALKYSPINAAITIEVVMDEDSSQQTSGFTIKISDQGLGLSDDEIKKAFTPFYRADNSRTQNTGGYGLGLAIVKRVVDLHKGEITLHTPDEGGLCVTIWLPA